MSNVNYTGSSAQRFMDFRSTLQGVSETKTDLFNSIEIFIPASLAETNILNYVGEGLAEDKPIVKTITADNYTEVMTGKLLEQWKPFFREGTNLDATIYLIVFYDTGFKVITDPKELVKEGLTGKIANKALSIAFKKLYNLAYFKTIFAEDYTGVAAEMAESPYNKVSNLFDMELCLANLCEDETKLSMFLAFYAPDLAKITYPSIGKITDTNVCNVLSLSAIDDSKAAVKFEETTADDRAKYFWGFLKLIGGQRTALSVNNGVYFDPIRLGVWMEKKNESRTYIGNKLAKIKLVNPLIKPTGLPNFVEEDVNDNLDSRLTDNADPKHVAYLLSVSDSSPNHSIIIDDKTVGGFPINAHMIAKYVDYTCSQTLAEFVANLNTLDKPVLVNPQTYAYIQKLVGDVLQDIARTKRLKSISLTFPPYEEAKKGNTFVGSAAWSAIYVDDLAGVKISGTVTF